MSINTVDIILMLLAGISFLLAVGASFVRPPLVHIAVGLTALGLLFWSIVPLIEFIRLA